ncbi:MAG: methionyl-tRNA formyltransferase [Actinomycetota bacterium]|nr:methionyl-tRNA formyltransferase [Actinomycetota bacterium]
MKLAYLGTPAIAVPPLRALHAAGHEVVLVVSGADKRRGRGGATSPSPVKAAALELGLPVSSDPDDVVDAGAELGVVVAYGRIIRPHVLAELPMVNLHFSLLPRWRGAAPVERAILAGDDRTGVCVMEVAEGLDTGDVYAVRSLEIGPTETADELRARLVGVGTDLLVGTLGEGLPHGEPQSDDGVTYAAKLTPADLELHWDSPAEQVLRTVRVGGAWTTWHGARFKVHAASVTSSGEAAAPGTFVDPVTVACASGAVVLEVVQPEGKARMDAAAWANGARPAGERLGT